MTRSGTALVLATLVMISGCSSTSELDEDQAIRASELNAQLGLAYMRQGENELALKKLKKSLRQNDDNPDAHHYIAELYRRLGKINKAESHYDSALSLTQEDSSLLNNYGVFLCDQKNYTKAQGYFARVLSDPLYKDKAHVHENIGLCAQSKGDARTAEKNLLQALKLNKQLPKSLLAMAQINFDKQLYAQSRQYLYKYLQIAKHNAQSLWLGILLDRRQGNKNRVASYSILLKGKFPDSKEAQLLRKLESKGRR